ncbi:MAG: helix-turn-helix domain-containing protein [Candidatus Omnitrophota bacterium]|nr:helix-turn-helix domain-containing protein [Candidatus Omnitrophota bacterium]
MKGCMYGTNIKRIREKKNITQEGLAKRVGVSRQAVCMWETGKRELRGTMLNKIAQIFSVPVSEILSEDSIKISLTGKGDSMKETLMSITRRRGEEVSMKKTSAKTAFTLAAPKAGKVALTGSFNSWDKSGTPLKKDKSGTWKTDLSLKPGKYEYKFIVDGQWWTDPANRNIVRNSFGSENSVIEIKG